MKCIKLFFIICTISSLFYACSSPDTLINGTLESETPKPKDSPDNSFTPSPSTPVEDDDTDWWRQNEKKHTFSWGYDVYRPGEEMGIYQEEGQLVRSTVYQGGELPLGVSIYLNRNDAEPITVGILMLVDGIPAPFIPDGEQEATYMHPFRVTQDAKCKFALTPVFKSESGRIDIIIAVDLMSPQGDTAVLPVYVDNQSGIYNTDENTNIAEVSKLPDGFQSPPQSGASLITCWLYPGDYDESMRTGQSAIQRVDLSSEGNEWLYESMTGLPGQLRTIFFLDYEPYIVSNGEAFVDWLPSEGEMLSLPIEFSDIEHPSMLMPVTIRMDDTDMKYETMILRRVLINPYDLFSRRIPAIKEYSMN